MKTSIILLFAIFVTSFYSNAQEDKIASMLKSVKGAYYVGSLDERYITSKEANATYKILIYLPVSYLETQRKYPIMILTDASWAMGIAQSTFDFMSQISKELPEVIIVGIAYPYSSSWDMYRYRFRDMAPTHVEGYNPSGFADKFVAFINKELFCK